jgi:bacteriorhodopsin
LASCEENENSATRQIRAAFEGKLLVFMAVQSPERAPQPRKKCAQTIVAFPSLFVRNLYRTALYSSRGKMLSQLSLAQFSLVSNMLSFAIASMLASFAFFVMAREQLTPALRPAMVLSSLVVLIAGYHYMRIYASWHAAYQLDHGNYVATGIPFNDAYRYVDWLLTVPLLCAELVAVMNLRAGVRGPMMAKLAIASALMIILGYPGEISSDNMTRGLWGAASTVPFLYILYVLWVELSKAAANESPEVKKLLTNTRLLILATWGFYPIAYLMPQLGIAGGGGTTVAVQVGYSIADIAAKCGYGVVIYIIARAKMAHDKQDAGSPALASA